MRKSGACYETRTSSWRRTCYRQKPEHHHQGLLRRDRGMGRLTRGLHAITRPKSATTRGWGVIIKGLRVNIRSHICCFALGRTCWVAYSTSSGGLLDTLHHVTAGARSSPNTGDAVDNAPTKGVPGATNAPTRVNFENRVAKCPNKMPKYVIHCQEQHRWIIGI